MLTNYDLEELASKLNIQIRTICMKDNLPSKVKDGNYIINLQSSDGGRNSGTHWTGLVVQGRNALFFDPFGVWPSIEVREFVKKRPGSHLAFTTKDIQDFHSDNCGLFVLGFLNSAQRGNHLLDSVEDFLNIFSQDTKKNDRIIKAYLRDSQCGCLH